MKVHEKIRLLREDKHWSQEDMAAKLNMSVSGYSKIERGETKTYIPKLEQIAKALEVDLVELIPQNGNNIYQHNSNLGGCNIIGSTELAFENQKLQMQLDMKDKELALQQREIEILREQVLQLKEINTLLKNEV
jgi:transcriptional regulator with XRE-family HTH domain